MKHQHNLSFVIIFSRLGIYLNSQCTVSIKKLEILESDKVTSLNMLKIYVVKARL